MTEPLPTNASRVGYRAYLRSRWPFRARFLAFHAMGATLALLVLDWFMTRYQAAPPTLARVALLRLPAILIPFAGWLAARRAPGWPFLPHLIVALSVLWTWSAMLSFFLLGLDGSVAQAATLFAALVTVAALMPVTGPGRAGVFAAMALGYVAMDLAWPHEAPLGRQLADDAVVVAFAIVQIVAFQTFAVAHRRGALLRHRLERAVTALEASRVRAARAVDEVGLLAAEVAHQVNNPLSAVKGNVRWLAREGSEVEHAGERTEVVQESLQAIDRIAAIVLDLKHRAAEQRAALLAEDGASLPPPDDRDEA